MHKSIMLQALRKAQTDTERFAGFHPSFRDAILRAFGEFETLLSVSLEKNLEPAKVRDVMESLAAVLTLVFVVETLCAPKGKIREAIIEDIQGQVARARQIVKTALKDAPSV